MPNVEPELEFYFGLLEKIKRVALRITPQTPAPKNVILSINRISEPINKADYFQPWSPIGVADNLTKDEVVRRQRALQNLNNLVDKKLLIDGSGFADPGASTIFDSWNALVVSAEANPKPLPPNPEREKAVAAANALLFSAPGEESDAYKRYLEFSEKVDVARANLTEKYLAAAATVQGLDRWPVTGKPHVNKVKRADEEWSTKGRRQEIQAAIDVLASAGGDAATALIAAAKRRIDNSKVVLSDIGAETPLVDVLPSNWCDPASNEGFSEFRLSVSEARTWSKEGKKSFKAGASFLSLAGGGGVNSTDGHKIGFSDNLEISFALGVARINRPWFITTLLNMGGWYIKGQPKHSVSAGAADQAKPENEVTWIPAIPTQMVVMKNLTITGSKASELEKWAVKQKTAAGGGTIFGISLGARAGSSTDSKNTAITKVNGGFKVEGVNVIGYVLEVMPASPKLDGFEAPAPPVKP